MSCVLYNSGRDEQLEKGEQATYRGAQKYQSSIQVSMMHRNRRRHQITHSIDHRFAETKQHTNSSPMLRC